MPCLSSCLRLSITVSIQALSAVSDQEANRKKRKLQKKAQRLLKTSQLFIFYVPLWKVTSCLRGVHACSMMNTLEKLSPGLLSYLSGNPDCAVVIIILFMWNGERRPSFQATDGISESLTELKVLA